MCVLDQSGLTKSLCVCLAGHRFRTTHDFGYVALDVLYTYAEDSGNYLCKATNKVGEAVNSCSVNVSGKLPVPHRTPYDDAAHPDQVIHM